MTLESSKTTSTPSKIKWLSTIISRLLGIFCLVFCLLIIIPIPVKKSFLIMGCVAIIAMLVILLCLLLFITGIADLSKPEKRLSGLRALIVAPLLLIAAFVSAMVGLFLVGGAGWGRPLRIRGRQLHPDLREGSDWTKGPRPDPSTLDEPTRHALEALWLHDAQKEHASVPAFSRISWLLAAVGAPAELMEWSHRAALEEIEHTRLCFALAAGYAGRSFTVEAMPDLLIGGLDMKSDPLITLANESILDGCQLEDFNADVASACATVCEEPSTRAVLEQIAREERSHADFSWALLEWLLQRNPGKIYPVIEKSLAELRARKRPTAVRWDKKSLVDKADQEQLLKHGRLPDERWAELWDIRMAETQRRLKDLIQVKHAI